MATVQDIVTAAYRKVGVVSEDEDMSAAMLANGVDAYNRMVWAWKLAGVDLEHTVQVAGDTFPYGDEYQEGFVYLLGSRISPDYTVPANFDADDWFRKFQAENMTITAATMPTALTRMPSRYWRDTRIR